VLPYTFISDTWGRGGQWEKEQVVPVMDRAILCHCLSVWMTPISQVITLSPTRFSRPPLDCQPTVSVPHSSALHKVHLAPCHLLGRALPDMPTIPNPGGYSLLAGASASSTPGVSPSEGGALVL
jgi:hypothetical protein